MVASLVGVRSGALTVVGVGVVGAPMGVFRAGAAGFGAAGRFGARAAGAGGFFSLGMTLDLTLCMFTFLR